MIALDHQQININNNDYLDGLANRWLTVLVAIEAEDFLNIKRHQDALIELGAVEQKAFWVLNERLQLPFQKLMTESQGGSQVNRLLQELQSKLVKIKPPRRSFLSTMKNMFLLLFSWHESAWQMWLARYPIHKQEISRIITQLAQCQQQLNRDNKVLLAEKQELDIQTEKLKNWFDLGCLLAAKIKHAISPQPKLSISGKEVVEREFLQVLQQRIVALQQQLLVARQTTMTLELFMAQNNSQIRNINHTIYTITSVIDVTARIAMLEEGNKNLHKTNRYSKLLNPSIDNKTLKHARQVIDQALSKMHAVQHQTQQFHDELLIKSNLSPQD